MAVVVEIAYLPCGDLLIEAGKYRWMASSEKMCFFSEFFSVCMRSRFKEGQERRIEIKEAKPWMVARIIQWVYAETFDRVCCERVWPRLFRPDFQQLVGNASHTVEYTQDSEEDALMSTYHVSAEVYSLAQRLMMPDLCKFIASEMLGRYHQQVYQSWPGPVYDTLKTASEEYDEIRETLVQLLAEQTFLDEFRFSMPSRLRNMINDDCQFACELLWEIQYKYEAAMESILPRPWQAQSELTVLKMGLSNQDRALASLRSLQNRGS